MGLSVCAAAAGRGSRNVRSPGTSPASEGSHEPEILALSPGIYLKFGSDLADSSGAGRNGTLAGTGGGFVTALAGNVGTGNLAFDTEGTASISIPHATADTLLGWPTDWATRATSYTPGDPTTGLLAGFRHIADVTVSCWFKPQTMPTGADKAVIWAKAHTAALGTPECYAEAAPITAVRGNTRLGGSVATYFDADGVLYVDVRSFRGRPCIIRTPDGAISNDTTYQLVTRLSYDGVTAWLNAAQFEDGDPNVQHVYGLCANIRGAVFVNNYAWTIGRAAWGGQSDIIVDEFCVFQRAPSATISQANVNTLAQQGSTPAVLAHPIWGRQTVNVSSFATIQAAVDNVSASGGGTVQLNSTTYTQNVVMKNNVRLRGNGRTNTTITGVITTPTPATPNIGVGTGDFLTFDNTLNISNSRAVGDHIVVRGLTNNVTGPATAMRFDRRWLEVGESQDGGENLSDGETFIVQAAGNPLTLEGFASLDFAAGTRQEILAFTPTTWIALDSLTVIGPAGSGESPRTFRAYYASHVRVTDCEFETDVDSQVDTRYSVDVSTLRTRHRKRHLGNVAGGGTALVCRSGSKDMVCYDITMVDIQRAIADVASNANFAPVMRGEFHVIKDIGVGSGNFKPKYGAHESCADCIFWNIHVRYGGCNVQGWKADVNWTVNAAGDGTGHWSFDAGLADSAIRNSFFFDIESATNDWHNATRDVERCHFENCETDTTGLAPPAGTFGTGADVCTYRNVDFPSPLWTEV